MNSPSLPTLVTGGTGKTGSRLAKLLQEAGYPVRIGSRSASPPFDWNDRDTWDAALDGCGAVYIAFQPDLALPGALEIVTAFYAKALAKGVNRIVLLSGRGEPEAEDAENTLRASDAEWTILRASWFNQNFAEGFVDWLRTGTLALPVRPIPEPFIDADDIADVGFAALTQPGHIGQLYEITGPRSLTFIDAVAEIATATGRDIRFTSIPPEEFRALAQRDGIPEDVLGLMLYLFTTVLDGRSEKPADGVQRALGRPPRDFSDFVRKTAATGVWEA